MIFRGSRRRKGGRGVIDTNTDNRCQVTDELVIFCKVAVVVPLNTSQAVILFAKDSI